MLPVAIGMGEGGEFYRPMAVSIIGGTITSTLLTLLVIPSFYDSIELNRERFLLKFRARAELGNPFLAFLQTFGEAIITIIPFRFLFRGTRWLMGHESPAEHPVERAARLRTFKVPEDWVARPKSWQRQGERRTVSASKNPYAARPSIDVEGRMGATKTADPPVGAG